MTGLNAVVSGAVSRYVGEYRTKDGNDVNTLRRALVYYRAAPDAPDPLVVPGESARRVLRRLGISRLAICEEWERRRCLDGVGAALDQELLESLIPAELLDVVGEMIRDRPPRATGRMQAALYRYAERTVPETRHRPQGGRVSPVTIQHIVDAYRRLGRALAEMRALEHPSPDLAAWTSLPRLRPPRVAPVSTKQPGTALHVIRRVLREYDQDVRHRLGAVEGEEETEAIERLSTVELWHAHVWRPMKYRLIVALLAVTGIRIGSLVALRLRHYEPRHRFADGTEGPALYVTELKGYHPDFGRWKGITSREAAMIESFALVNRRLYTERVPTRGGVSARILKEPRPMVSDPYLITPTTWHPDERSNTTAISRALRGGSAQRALLPLHTAEEIAQEPGLAFVGQSAHCLRRASEQLVAPATADQLGRDGIAHVPAQAIADAVLDRENIRLDPYGYADISSETGRERWGRYGIAAASAWLWTDRGARKWPDLERYRQLLYREGDLLEALAVEEETLARLRKEAVARPRATQEDVVSLIDGIQSKADREGQLREVRGERERVVSDRSTWESVPDDHELPATASAKEALSEVEREVRARLASGLPSNVRRLPRRTSGHARDRRLPASASAPRETR